MPAIFISYRRIDSKAYAGRLFDRLSQHFGPDHVFMDVEGGIARGEDFAHALQRAVESVDAMIVLMGRQWLSCTDHEGQRRLDRSDDWVRVETATALRRDILVLPVLVDGASMPGEAELPEDIRALARRQASEITDTRWSYDVAQIIAILERRLGAKRRRWTRKPLAWAAGATLVVAASAVGISLWRATPVTRRAPASDASPTATAPATPSPSPAPSSATPAPTTPQAANDLSGYWRDDDGALYLVVAASGGMFDMSRIEPPEESPTYRRIRLDGRDVEIAIGVMPSGTQQAQADLQLSPDGRFMTGLVKSTQIEGTPTNWVLRRADPPRAGAAPAAKPSKPQARNAAPLGVPSGVATQIGSLRMQVRSVAFSPDGRLLAAAGFRVKDSDPAQAIVWETQQWQVARTLGPHPGDVYAVAFSPDGKTIATATWGAVLLWDAGTGAPLRSLKGHERQVWTLAFSPDGTRLASGGADKTVRLWDVASGLPVRVMSGHAESVQSLAFSPDGKLLASGAHYSREPAQDVVMLWDGASGAQVRRLAMPGVQNSAESLAFSADGRWLAAGSFGETKLWNTADWTLRLLPNGQRGTLHASVVSVAFSKDAKVLATVEAERKIKFWDPATGEPIKVLEGTEHGISALAYSGDGRWLASAGQLERGLRVWR